MRELRISNRTIKVKIGAVLCSFALLVTGCMGSGTGDPDDDDGELLDWDELETSRQAYDWRQALHYSMDMEFIPDTDRLLISEWPIDPWGIPVISTWGLKDGMLEEIAAVELPDSGVVQYSESAQCSIKMAIRSSQEKSEVFLTRCMSNTSVVLENYLLDEDGRLDSASRTVLLELDTGRPYGTYMHIVGELEFDSAGYLCMFQGHSNLVEAAIDPSSPFGSMLRMEILANGSIGPAEDNPHQNNQSWHPLVHSTGFRMPWSAALDENGVWWVGDVGEDQQERVQMVDRSGLNFGFGRWGDMGNDTCVDCEGLTHSVLNYTREYNHTFMVEDSRMYEAPWAAIWVGEQVPDSDAFPESLRGRILFGDFTRGFIRGLDPDDPSDSIHVTHLVGVVDIEVHEGTMYALTTGIQIPQEVRDPGMWRANIN